VLLLLLVLLLVLLLTPLLKEPRSTATACPRTTPSPSFPPSRHSSRQQPAPHPISRQNHSCGWMITQRQIQQQAMLSQHVLSSLPLHLYC
jgi:hypothetical protein